MWRERFEKNIVYRFYRGILGVSPRGPVRGEAHSLVDPKTGRFLWYTKWYSAKTTWKTMSDSLFFYLCQIIIFYVQFNFLAGQKPIISESIDVESYLQGFTNLTTRIGASISILSGSGIRLLCPVKGVPKPVISWKIQSKQNKNRAVFDRVSNSLTIPRLTPQDFGNYICTAKNILGETSAASAVNVIGKYENCSINDTLVL